MKRFSVAVVFFLFAAALSVISTEPSAAQAAQDATCNGREATLIGTDGPDVLNGSPGDDVIVGLGGADKIYGFEGNDVICGGAGADRIFGGEGDDYINAGRGRDRIEGGAGNDTIIGGKGADRLSGQSDNDALRGGAGNDFLDGGYGTDDLVGGDGFDACQDEPANSECEPYWLAFDAQPGTCPSGWQLGSASAGNVTVGASNLCRVRAGINPTRSTIRYPLAGNYGYFSAGIHVSLDGRPSAPIDVTVLVDGVAATTRTLNRPGAISNLSVQTKGANVVELVLDAEPGTDAVISVVSPVGSSVRRPARPTLPSAKSIEPATKGRKNFKIGVSGRSIPWDLAEAADYKDDVGRNADIVHGFANPNIKVPLAEIRKAQRRGHIVMITLEPRDVAASPNPAYSIITGAIDDDLRRWARQIKKLDDPVWIRWMHELNGFWYPWGSGARGNTPTHVVSAYRTAKDIFDEEGVTNVKWVWSPNAGATVSDYRAHFPGDSYVDYVGLDGYNGGTELTQFGGWKSFKTIFDQSIDDVGQVTSKPIIIAETSSVEADRDKALWIRRMFKLLANHKQVEALIWFQIDKGAEGEANWRYDSSKLARRAFIQGARRIIR